MIRSFVFGILAFSLTQTVFSQSSGSNSSPQHPPVGNTYHKATQSFSPDAGAPETAAFLKSEKEVFFANGTDLQLDNYQQSLGGNHFSFLQTFRGIPIYHASIKANLNRQMRMMNVLDNLQDVNGTVVGEFATTSHDAAAWAELNMKNGQQRFSAIATAQWWMDAGKCIPAWVIETDGEESAWEVILDANDLSEIQRKDRAIYHHRNGGPHKTQIDSTGTAMVFNPDPLTTAQVIYGGNYVDNNDQDSPFLNNERQNVVLQDIFYANGSFRLTGPYVIIDDSLESPMQPSPTSTNGNFEFTRAQQGFEAAMCYYYIDHYQRYIQSLGFNNLMNQPLNCDPHGLSQGIIPIL